MSDIQQRRARSKELSPTANSNGQLYGISRYMQPTDGARLLGEAEFKQFAPCPCICYQCLVPDKARKRHYARVYENRLEINNPTFPCLCCSKERCVQDYSRNYYFDQQPSRVGMICHFIPMIICGPPVIYNYIPRCCCAAIDLRPCFGETIFCAPCNCFNLRSFLCCGRPCFTYCACPLVIGVKNGEEFLGRWRFALESYAREKAVPTDQIAQFKRVADRFCDCDTNQDIPPISVQVMDRGSAASRPAEAYATPILSKPQAVTGMSDRNTGQRRGGHSPPPSPRSKKGHHEHEGQPSSPRSSKPKKKKSSSIPPNSDGNGGKKKKKKKKPKPPAPVEEE